MYNIQPEVDKNFVFSKLSQEQIMEYYLGVPVVMNKKFSSPFREDKNPSCGLKYKGDKLLFKDFTGHLKGDCIDIVKYKYSVGYYEALKRVAIDFNLIDSDLPPVPKKDFSHLEKYKLEENQRADIKIKVRKWKLVDKEYWYDRFSITRKTLAHFKVYPVETVWLNGSIIYNYYNNDDICYAYCLGKEEYKIYLPNRNGNKDMKFLQNTKRVQGYRQLPKEGKFCLWTKSLKDVMVAYQFNIPAIALSSESMYPPQKLVDVINSRFKFSLSLYDFDYAGIKMANYLKNNHFIKPLFLTDGTRRSIQNFGAKDLAEVVDNYGVPETQKLINSTKQIIEHEIAELSKEIPFY